MRPNRARVSSPCVNATHITHTKQTTHSASMNRKRNKARCSLVMSYHPHDKIHVSVGQVPRNPISGGLGYAPRFKLRYEAVTYQQPARQIVPCQLVEVVECFA